MAKKTFNDFTYGVGLELTASSFKQVKDELKLNLDNLSKMVKSYGKALKIDPNADLFDEMQKIKSIMDGIDGSGNSFAGFVDKGVLGRIASLEHGLLVVSQTSDEVKGSIGELKDTLTSVLQPLKDSGKIKFPVRFDELFGDASDQTEKIKQLGSQVNQLQMALKKIGSVKYKLDDATGLDTSKNSGLGQKSMSNLEKLYDRFIELNDKLKSAHPDELVAVAEEYEQVTDKLYGYFSRMSGAQYDDSYLENFLNYSKKTYTKIAQKKQQLEQELQSSMQLQEKYEASLSVRTRGKSGGVATDDTGKKVTLRAHVIPDTTASEWIGTINKTISEITPKLDKVHLTPTFSRSKNIEKEMEGNLAHINHAINVDLKVADNIEQFNAKIKNIDQEIQKAKTRIEKTGDFKIRFGYDDEANLKDTVQQAINKFKKIDSTIKLTNGKEFLKKVSTLKTNAATKLKDIPASIVIGNQDATLSSVDTLRSEIESKIGNIGVNLSINNMPQFMAQAAMMKDVVENDYNSGSITGEGNNGIGASTTQVVELSKKAQEAKNNIDKIKSTLASLSKDGFKSPHFAELGIFDKNLKPIKGSKKELEQFVLEYEDLQSRVSASADDMRYIYGIDEAGYSMFQQDVESLRQLEQILNVALQSQIAYSNAKLQAAESVLEKERQVVEVKREQAAIKTTDSSSSTQQTQELAMSAEEASSKVRSLNGTLVHQRKCLDDLNAKGIKSTSFVRLGEWDKDTGTFKKNSPYIQDLINQYNQLRDARLKAGGAGKPADGEEAKLKGKLVGILRSQKKHVTEIIAKNQAELESAKQISEAYKRAGKNKASAAQVKMDVDTTSTTKKIDKLTEKLNKAHETFELLNSNGIKAVGNTGLGDVQNRLTTIGSGQSLDELINEYNILLAKKQELERTGQTASTMYAKLIGEQRGLEQKLSVIYQDQLKYTESKIKSYETQISKAKELLQVEKQQVAEKTKKQNDGASSVATTQIGDSAASAVVQLDGTTLNSIAKDETLKSIDNKISNILERLNSNVVISGSNISIEASNVSVSGKGTGSGSGKTGGSGDADGKKEVKLTTLSSYSQQITAMEERIKRTGLYTDDLKQKFVDLNEQLNAIKVQDDADAYKFDLDRFKEDFEQFKTYEKLYQDFIKSQAKQIQLNDQIATSSGPTSALQEQLKIEEEVSKNLETQLTQYTTLYDKRARQLAIDEAIKKANQEITKSSAAQSDKEINRQNVGIDKLVESANKKLLDMQHSMQTSKIPMADAAIAKLKQYEQLFDTLKIKQQQILDNPNLLKDDGYSNSFKSLLQQMNDVGAEFNTLQKSSENFLSKIKSIEDIKQLGDTFDPTNLEQMHAAMTEFANSTGIGAATLIEFNDAERTATFEIKNGHGQVQQLTVAYDYATNSLGRYTSKTKESLSETQKFFNSLKHSFQNVARYIASFGSVYRVFAMIKQGVSYVKEIDAALTELKKVTNETDEAYDKFLRTMSRAADRVGGTVKELTSSAADWARLGYSMKQAGELAENTAILMNVSEFDDVSKATDTLISSLQAFKREGQDVGEFSMQIIDKYNEVGNNYAISTSDLAESLTRSSAALVAANNSIDQSIAMTTAANTTIQDPESVGNALKVVSMRIRGVKTELEEAGEDTEGMVENTAKLQEKIMALTNVDGQGGVDILTESGAFKSTYDILLAISKVWKDMDDMDQAALLELVAGKTRGSVVAALFQNGDIMEDAFNSSTNASGSAKRELETYLDSIQGKIDKFNNAVQTMWMNAIESDVVKGLVDIGTHLIKFIDNLGLVKTLVIAIGGYFTRNLWGSAFSKQSKGIADTIEQLTRARDKAAADVEKDPTNTKKTKALSDAEGALNAYRNSVPEYTQLENKLKSLQDENVKLSESLGLSKQKFSELSKAGQDTGAVASEIENVTKKIDDNNAAIQTTQKEMETLGGKTAGVGATSQTTWQKFTAGAKGAGKAIVATLKSMMIMAAVSEIFDIFNAIGNVVVDFFDGRHDSTEELLEEYDQWNNKLSECESELKSLESELEDTNKQIEDLQAQGALSFTEQEELERLQAISAELERQIGMKQTLQSSLQQGTNAAAINAGESYLNSSFSSKQSKTERQEEASQEGEKWGSAAGWAIAGVIAAGAAGFFTGGATWAALPGVLTAAGAGSMAGGAIGNIAGSAIAGSTYDSEQTVAEAIATMSASRDALIKARDEAYAAYASSPDDKNAIKKYEEASQALSTYDENMATHISQMSQFYNTILENWEKASTEQKEQAREYGDMIDAYTIEMGGVNAKENAIKRIFGTEMELDPTLKSVKEALNEMAEAGEAIDLKKAFGGNTAEYDAFVKRLRDMGIYVYEVENAFIELKKAEDAAAAVTFTGIAKELQEVVDAISGARSVLDEFYELGHATPGTLLGLADQFNIEGLTDEWEKYVEVMLDGTSSTEDAIAATESLVQKYIDLQIRGKDWSASQKNILVTALKDAGVTNAEQFVNDKSQQYALEEIEELFKNESAMSVIKGDWTNMYHEQKQALQEKYGLEAEYLDTVIAKLQEKRKLELNVSTAQEQLGDYTTYIQQYKKMQQDYEEAAKKYGTYRPDLDLVRVDGYVPEGYVTYEHTYEDQSTGELITNQYQFYYSESQGVDEYKNLIDQMYDFPEFARRGFDEGWLNTDGSVKDGIANSLQAALSEAQANLDAFDEKIQTEFTIEYDLKLADQKPVIDTLSGLTDAYNQLLSAQQLFNEVCFDGQQISEEYYTALRDQLQGVTIAGYEFKDAIDTSNGYVVKNVSLLNTLLKTSKLNTAQNVQVAKSQARIRYAELYKQLKQLTNGQKAATSATRNQVKTLYEEMIAVQKNISRYSALEQQLLGATNAYDEFAEAQEIDAANDFESKSEEMVGHLVDAFRTAKLGTESAQAAIKGLVPSSVYEDLETLDEKMAAIYKYATEELSMYYTVKFNDDGSIESVEMNIDNIKKFVEEGISKGVFTGSWEEWDLDSTVHSLDDIAQRMGVTKEIIYAFLQAMETYDISWVGGDASTLLDKLIPNTSDIKTVGEQMQKVFDQTPIDLTARVKVSKAKMIEAGYTDFEGDYATVYSSSFNSENFGLYNDDGSTFEILTTPILPNGEVLSEQELIDYINDGLSSGKSLNELDVFIGAYDSVEAAKEAAEVLHEAQEKYYNMLASYSLENSIYQNTQERADLEYKVATGEITSEEYREQMNELDKEADLNSQAALDNATAWMAANKAYEEAKTAVDDLNKKLKDAKDAGDDQLVANLEGQLETALTTMYDEYSAMAAIPIPTKLVFQTASDEIQEEIDALYEYIVSSPIWKNIGKDFSEFIVFDEDTQQYKWIDSWYKIAQEGGTIYNLLGADEAERFGEIVDNYFGLLNQQRGFDLQVNEETTVEPIQQVVDSLGQIVEILRQQFGFTIDDSGVVEKMSGWERFFNDLSFTVPIIFEPKTNTPTTGLFGILSGLFSDFTSESGTANANGSWGVPRTETSLVGELGPEMLVRGNMWHLVGANGAEFTQIKRGDIIFNHKQTKSLLENGHVTSRGKAYASGTAYDTGSVHPWLGGLGNVDDDWQNIDSTLTDAMNNAADSVVEFSESLDWIKIRMDELDETLNKYSASMENASTFITKNDIIDEMIQTQRDIYSNAIAGAEYYANHAEKYLEGMSQDLVDAAKNGAISITEFEKEQDEATVKAINNYRQYAQEAASLTQKSIETIAAIRDLAIQRIDNAQHTGDVMATVEASQTARLQNAVDFDEARGLITDPNYYAAMMENSKKTVEYLTTSFNAMQDEFNEAVKSGTLKVGSDAWYENLDKLYQVQNQIAEANTQLEEFQNSINEIYWTSLDQMIDRFDYISAEAKGLIELMDSDDLFNKPKDEKGWGQKEVQWTKEGIATLGLHAQRLEWAEEKSKAYAIAIEDLNAEYEEGHYSESEYYEKLNDLTNKQYDAIEASKSEKDAIVKLNKARLDEVKEGIKKQIDAYSELIEKKKEELDSEKDLYDFQKSIQDSNKNIADIERKIAALSSDNSLSAVAKRKQLEAELAEAREEQADLYYDRSIEKQNEALDDELESYKKEKEAEIEQLDLWLENVELVVTESLGIVQENAETIGATLSEKASEYGLTVSSAVLEPWRSGATAIDEYTTKFGDSASETTKQLEAMRAKWQEIKEELAAANAQADEYYNKQAAIASGPSVGEINQQNEGFASARPQATSSTSRPLPQQETQQEAPKAITVGGTINASGAPIYSWAGDTNGKTQYFGYDPKYVVIREQNGYLLVRHHTQSGATGWFKKSDVSAYAKGSTGVSKDQLAWIDELGEELVMHADGNGRLAFLSKGTSVVPHDITENLMKLGQLDPTEVLNRNRPQITPSKSIVNNTEIRIDASVGELIHVEHIDGNNPDEIVKIVNKAYDKKMQELNNSIKKFVR